MKVIYAFLIFLNIVYSKVISIKSGGLKGFYMFGISKYIKENYNLNNFHFYGSSAGSWNSLYLSQKNNDDLLSKKLISMNLHSFKNLYDIELQIGNFFENNYKSHDFNLKNIHITVSIVKRFGLEKKIHGSFNTLEDTINCCMASSHIPYITNSAAIYTYRNKGFRHLFCHYINDDTETATNAGQYFCEKCDFKCSKQSNFNMHLATEKHKMMTNDDTKTQKNAKAYIYECGKSYKYRQGLSLISKTVS